jgi:Putative binding domain, N-terminal/Viral BACON domain
MSVPSTLPTLAAAGGQGSVDLTVAAECVWSVSSEAAWISIVSPTTGQGSGTITFVAAENPSSATRRGALVVSERRVEVIQAGAACDYSLDPAAVTMQPTGGEGAVNVRTLVGCEWTASSEAPWLSIVGSGGGVGPGTLRFSVANNDSGARVGTLKIAERAVTVSQDGVSTGSPTCVLTLSKRSHTIGASGGPDTLLVRGLPQCSWVATSQAPWIVVTSGAVGSGDGTVTLIIVPNDGPTRVGVVVVADQAYSITQAAAPPVSCSYTLSATQHSAPASGGATSVDVTTGPTCPWTVTSGATWITVTSGARGTGSGRVNLTIEPNSGAARSASVIIADQTYSVTQAAAPVNCTYELSQPEQNVGAAGGPATVGVLAPAGCSWTALSNASWLTVESGAGGSGNGTVGLMVAANVGGERTGTVTIAGRTHTIRQAAAPVPCSYSLNSSSASVPATASSISVGVTTQPGCAWTAASQASWITVRSGSSGTGSGMVHLDVAPNSGAERTGSVTIAGATFTVRQAAAFPACTYTISPVTQNVPLVGGTFNVEVTTQPECSWTAVPDSSWIDMLGNGSGSGSKTVRYRVATTVLPRSGRITIAGQVLTVNQTSLP